MTPKTQQLNISCNLVSGMNYKNQNLLRDLIYQPDGEKTLTQTELSYPFFVPLQHNTTELEHMEIELTNEFGEPIQFNYGGKTMIDADIQPMKRKKMDHFTLNVFCQEINIIEPVHMSDNWEVAAVDIFYPFTYENIKENEISIKIKTKDEGDWTEETEQKLPAGAYSSDQEFMAFIDELLKPNMSLKKDESGNYMNPACLQFNLGVNDELLTEFSPVFANILGVVTEVPLFWHINKGTSNVKVAQGPFGVGEKNITSDFKTGSTPFEKIFPRNTDPMRGFKIFYIYADELVDYVPVGNVSAPLLRTLIPNINSDSKIGEVLYHEFESLQWCPLKKLTTKFSQIKVDITDELGRKINFVGFKKPKVTLAFQVIE